MTDDKARKTAEFQARERLRNLAEDIRLCPEMAMEVERAFSEAARPPVEGGLPAYKGPSNHHDIFKHLVGEKITAAFQAYPPGRRDLGPHLHLVMESGHAFVIGKTGSFWKEDSDYVRRVVSARADQIKTQVDQLRDLPGVRLP
jgi:hypothetical protein